MRWRGWHDQYNILYNTPTWKRARTHATYATLPCERANHTMPSGKLGYMDMDTEEWIVVLIGVGIVVLVFALIAGLM